MSHVCLLYFSNYIYLSFAKNCVTSLLIFLPLVYQVFAEEGKRSTAKVKHVTEVSLLLRQGKFIKQPENSSSTTDPERALTDLSETTLCDGIENQVNLLTKHRSRRKICLQKALAWKDFKSDVVGDDRPGHSSAVNRMIEKVFIFLQLVKVVF